MSTYNLTTGADGKFQSISTEYTTISKTIDFSAVNTATVPPSSAAASSILQVLTLPAGFLCLSVIAEVLTASAASKPLILFLLLRVMSPRIQKPGLTI